MEEGEKRMNHVQRRGWFGCVRSGRAKQHTSCQLQGATVRRTAGGGRGKQTNRHTREKKKRAFFILPSLPSAFAAEFHISSLPSPSFLSSSSSASIHPHFPPVGLP